MCTVSRKSLRYSIALIALLASLVASLMTHVPKLSEVTSYTSSKLLISRHEKKWKQRYTLRPLYPQTQTIRYPLPGMLDDPWFRYERGNDKKKRSPAITWTFLLLIIFVFWDIMKCSPLKFIRCFEITRRLHLQFRRISQSGSMLFCCWAYS
jgi:hypothetical protein